MNAPVAVVVGFVGKLPLAGMALFNLHYIAGLMDLGYRVHYVERQNSMDEYYNPATNSMCADVSAGLAWLDAVLPTVGIGPDGFSLIDHARTCHGSGWKSLEETLSNADFVLNLADATWFDELERCPRRAFLDGDPLFTQVALNRDEAIAPALIHYPKLFTYCMRMGAADCSVPDAGRLWIPTRPVVATRLWKPLLGRVVDQSPITTVMNWSAWSDVEYEGQTYGQKGREVERLIELPKRAGRRIVIAIGGPAPHERLRDHGWELVSALDVTRTIPAYRAFIDGSCADLGIAKHAYVASRSGWFSDRSLCYLASGRPVLHQDTGFQDWLGTGEGIFAFSGVDDIVGALEMLDRDYGRHARAARTIAEQEFEARKVIGQMLDDCGFR